MTDAQPKRIAMVWHRDKLVRVNVDGEWPETIESDGRTFVPTRDLRGFPIVTGGRHSGVEFVSYHPA